MAIPSLAMIPSGYKDGKVYSVLPSNGDGDFTFSRGSNATRVNKDGLIETVTGDTPRLDYSDSSCPSLLLEPQSTNLIAYSEDFTQWGKLNSTVTSNLITSPDGTQNSDLINYNISSSNGYIRQSHSASQYVSFYVKYKDIQWLMVYGSGLGAGKFVDIKNSVVGSDVGSGANIQIINVGNDWKRIIFYSSSANITQTSIYAAISDGSYAAVSLTGSVYLWGAQAEALSYSTSYIPTNGATATRLADVCTDAGTSDTFNDSEGVLMAEISALADDESGRYLSISNVGNYQIRIGFFSGELYVQIRINGSVVYSHSETVILTNNNKISIKYTNNTQKVYINGYLVNSETVSTIFPLGTLTSLRFNNGDLLGGEFYGNTKQIQYYNSALTDSELEELTSWESFLEMAAGQNYTIK